MLKLWDTVWECGDTVPGTGSTAMLCFEDDTQSA
jgi:hypothetical protein